MQFQCVLFFIVVAAASTKIRAEPTQRSTRLDETRAQCIDNSAERTAALVARDWSQLIRLSKRNLNLCSSVYGPEQRSNLHARIAVANSRMEKHREALDAADLCIRTYYPNTTCHLERVRAQTQLRRWKDAQATLEIARRLIAHSTEEAKKHFERQTDVAARDFWSARLEQLDAEAEELAQISP